MFKGKKAFTLVELLVVISIIALLLSILMPSLNKARDLARRVVCISNMHQWATAVNLYTNDNDDKFPVRYWRDEKTGQVTGPWHNNLQLIYVEGRNNLLGIFCRPYLNDYKSTICPGNPKRLEDWDTQLENNVSVNGEVYVLSDYGLYVGFPKVLTTGIYWGTLREPGYIPPFKVTRAPSKMAVTACYTADNCFYDDEWIYYHPRSINSDKEPVGSPAGFADGHAEFVKYKNLTPFQEYTRYAGIAKGTRIWWPNPKSR